MCECRSVKCLEWPCFGSAFFFAANSFAVGNLFWNLIFFSLAKLGLGVGP